MSLILKGATLGKRHQHYNSLLETAVLSDKVQPAKIDYEKTDIENIFNIDIASNNKDVEYILDVLKGDDLLYVSRAIKRSNWLINDDQFAHIIEPQYLHTELFPQMMPKASCKFLLHIRLTLKKESRVEQFFQYFRHKNLNMALKWLPNCPLSVVEEAIEKYSTKISPKIFKRLCERSITILDIVVKSHKCYSENVLQAIMILLRHNPEKYMDLLTYTFINYLPYFGKKKTEIIMKKCPHRFTDDFEKYMDNIDLDTFAKCMKKDEIENFILRQLVEVKYGFNYEKIQKIIKYMPEERQFEFIKQIIERKTEISTDDCGLALKWSRPGSGVSGGASRIGVYCLYKCVPFDTAFTDLEKMIRTESNPDERNAMLMILIITARKRNDNIYSLLQYYRERHINETFRFKVLFINDLLQKTDPHLYNEKMWILLDEIFRSMEVYVESDNNVQTCLKAIIVRKVLRGEAVPDIVEHKFVFDTLKPIQRKLNEEQKAKVFKYLYDIFLNKLNECNMSNHAELAEYVEQFQQGLNLLKDWKKNLADFPDLINKIKDCAKIKKEKGWTTSLTPLYDIDKSWRISVFEDSLILSPSQLVCVNALKHDPELLLHHRDELDSLRFNNSISMKQVLRKIRIYWTQTIATEWMLAYRKRLDKHSGLKAVVRGLFCLLNQQQLSDFLKKHEPRKTKINWADADEFGLSLCKAIAKNMHIARPQIKPEAVLAYAKGDYVHFTQPSLNAMLYNIKTNQTKEFVITLLNGITSLQKHGIHLAFVKLSTADIIQIFLDVWESNKNLSVRKLLVQNTHDLLLREQNEALVAELWELFQMFIDSLTAEENKTIFNIFGRLGRVHQSIKAAYCMKSYKFLKSLPVKAVCKRIIQEMKEDMKYIFEQLDVHFVSEIVLEFVDQVYLNEFYEDSHRHDMQLLAFYLLSADDESSQLKRYEKIFVPLLEKSLASWNLGCCYAKQNLERVLDHLYRTSTNFAFKMNKANPVTLYKNILAKLESTLPVHQNYLLFRWLKLSTAFIDLLWKKNSDSETPQNWTSDADDDKLHLAITSEFGEVVAQYLKDDVNSYGISTYRVFARTLKHTLDSFSITWTVCLKYFKSWLGDEEFIAMYLLVIEVVSNQGHTSKHIEDIKEIHKMLLAHPKAEVKISYYSQFCDHPEIFI